MGAVVSGPRSEGSETSRRINRELAIDRKAKQYESKLLLLGSGECGKSTILKQMKILHLDGYTIAERQSFVDAIRYNIIGGIHDVLVFCAAHDLPLSETVSETARTLRSRAFELNSSSAAHLKLLCSEPSINLAIEKGAQFHLPEQFNYFLTRIDTVAQADYLPDTDDILRLRLRTLGVTDIKFETQGGCFRMVDVGGQRSERRKWISQFDEVDAVFFVASLADYDRMLFEQPTVNRMKEALSVFSDVINMPDFQQTSIILFLNKNDLFAKKIFEVDLNFCFASYTGGRNYDKAVVYIKNRFLSKNKGLESRHIYVHITTATDTNNVRFVFDSVQDLLTRGTLNRNQLY